MVFVCIYTHNDFVSSRRKCNFRLFYSTGIFVQTCKNIKKNKKKIYILCLTLSNDYLISQCYDHHLY